MPEAERLLPRFRAAHTQVLGISVDSQYSHAAWAAELGGISFPLLADFHPKGAVGRTYGVYLDDVGIDDRATVLIDAAGEVRHADSVSPSGRRDIAELAAMCEAFDRAIGCELPPVPAPRSLDSPATLFVKSACGPSRRVLLAARNLHLDEALETRNVSEDDRARRELVARTGRDQAPCLIRRDGVMQDSDDIVRFLLEHGAPDD